MSDKEAFAKLILKRRLTMVYTPDKSFKMAGTHSLKINVLSKGLPLLTFEGLFNPPKFANFDGNKYKQTKKEDKD